MRFFIFPCSLFLIIFNFSAFSDDSSDESRSSLGIYSATSSPRISSVTLSPKIYSATSSPKIRPLQISDDEFEKVQNLYKPMKKTEKARLKKLKKSIKEITGDSKKIDSIFREFGIQQELQEIEDLRLRLRDSSRNRTFITQWPQAVERSNRECKKYLFRQHDPDSFEDQDKKNYIATLKIF